MKTKSILTILLILTAYPIYAQHNLKFNQQGEFKIVQFTDVHYKPGAIQSDTAIMLINEVLEAEKPDLVVFTGDLAWAEPAKECFDKVTRPVIKHKTPWAYVNGNHDNEQGWTRTQIMDYLVTKPYCMAQHGDKNLKGEGNYILEIRSSQNQDEISALFYFLDSGSYNKSYPDVGWSYDWFDQAQVTWYRNQSAAYTTQNNGTPYPALAFFHIPLAEYPLMSADSTAIIGHKKEKECNGKINSGMFAAMLESKDIMATFAGHDHDNDYIGNYYGIALAYGRYSGGNTVYNNLGLNGSRIINLKEGKREFSTYIRLRGGEKLFNVNYPDDLIKKK